MYSLKILEKAEISNYATLLDAELRFMLKDYDPDKNIAIGARDKDKILGFVYGSIFNPENEALMTSTIMPHVDPEYRNKGIGTDLLQTIEMEARKRDCAKMTCGFKYIESEFEAAKKVLSKCGWEPPEIHGYSYETTTERFFTDFAWTKRSWKFFNVYFFPWTELTEEERRKLKEEDGPDSWKVEGASPFYFDGKFEENTSLGMRVNGNVDGWIINHQIAPDTILYGSYFVRKKHRRLGYSIALLLESVKRQRKTVFPRSTWYVRAQDKEIKKFYQKIFGPSILKEEVSWHSTKVLTVQEGRQKV